MREKRFRNTFIFCDIWQFKWILWRHSRLNLANNFLQILFLRILLPILRLSSNLLAELLTINAFNKLIIYLYKARLCFRMRIKYVVDGTIGGCSTTDQPDKNEFPKICPGVQWYVPETENTFSLVATNIIWVYLFNQSGLLWLHNRI